MKCLAGCKSNACRCPVYSLPRKVAMLHAVCVRKMLADAQAVIIAAFPELGLACEKVCSVQAEH